MAEQSVYQTEAYKKALGRKKAKLVYASMDFFAVEKIIKFAFLKRKIVEARGTPSEKDVLKFKEICNNYFYGVISPCLMNIQPKRFEKSGYKKSSNYTFLLDLRKTEEEIWQGFEKKSIRWGINTAKKNKLDVEHKPSQKDIEQFYNIYSSTAKEGGFDAEPKEFLCSLFSSNIARLILIKNKRNVVAGGLVILDKENNYAILDLTSASDDGFKLQAMPLLYWEIILFAKNSGLEFIDLGGYDSEARVGEKTYNINKFKERFGGKIVEQPFYSTNWRYAFIRALLKNLRFVKSFYKKDFVKTS